jgi:hypothetical protein
VALAWKRDNRAEVAVCVLAVTVFLWLNISIAPWHGGWAPGPRYLVPMLPFAAMLAGGVLVWITRTVTAPALRVARGVAALAVAGLLALSAANMLAATAVKPEIDMKYDRPYEQYVWPKFHAGQLSVSKQSIDMRGFSPDAPPQAWNLGMRVGLDGIASLVPLGGWMLACAAWLGWALGLFRRRSRGGSRQME